MAACGASATAPPRQHPAQRISTPYADTRVAGRLHTLVSNLAAQNPDVIIALTDPAVLALKKAGVASPVVFAFISDPVGLGIVKSLARPDGNFTGLTYGDAALGGKRLELLQDRLLRRAAQLPLGEWNRRLGALPVEAYHCFMVWVPWTQPITSVWRGVSLAHKAGSPRIISRAVPRSPEHAAGFTSVKDKPPAALKKRRP